MIDFTELSHNENFTEIINKANEAQAYLETDNRQCILACFQVLGKIINWVFDNDKEMKKPEKNDLNVLIYEYSFRNFIDEDIFKNILYIYKNYRIVTEKKSKISFEQTKLCIEYLYNILKFIIFCYTEQEPEAINNTFQYSRSELNYMAPASGHSVSFSLLRKQNRNNYRNKPRALSISEAETRKALIDTALISLGWILNADWENEYKVIGMPNRTGEGFVDYVLFDDSHIPLAVIEAKKTSISVEQGRQQAKLYADILEKDFGRRPIIFLSNGYENRIITGTHQERIVSDFYSKNDLTKFYNLAELRQDISNVQTNNSIADRYYQIEAIKTVCKEFNDKKRKALLVMATGSGKTRTIISLCDILLNSHWVKNILFLADRNALVKQGCGAFKSFLKGQSVTNLLEDSNGVNDRIICSTYQTMINYIDKAKDDSGVKLYSPGHFDLIICDEAHRSIYNKYKDIFNYFDALLVGLTATPKNQIDKNTYSVFELPNGMPTYAYELSQAIADGYLVDYTICNTKLKLIESGITYAELSLDEKIEYENTFADEDGNIPEYIDGKKLNAQIFNEDTIKEALHILFDKGLKINYGTKLGKTIIFARNHKHAEKILEVFNKEYPSLVGFAEVIDNEINYAGQLIDDFSVADKYPQIAISVDMLDTGIDVPEILNLMFFKPVKSITKFHQMIGRGTRLCKGLIDGQDKQGFYIFDLCRNFEYFGTEKQTSEKDNTYNIKGQIFLTKVLLCKELQEMTYQTQSMYVSYRSKLIDDLVYSVSSLYENNYAVKQRLKYVHIYKERSKYNQIKFEDVKDIKEYICPIIPCDSLDDLSAYRFDSLIYSVELGLLQNKNINQYIKNLMDKVKALSEIASEPDVHVHIKLISKILTTDYLKNADVFDYENIRKSLRGLLVYLKKEERFFNTHFTDEITSFEFQNSNLADNSLANYKFKVEAYIRNNQDNQTIKKLKTNKPLNSNDIKELEKILWNEQGSKSDYNNEYGDKPLGQLVREINGLDKDSVQEAFADFLNNNNLNTAQSYFVKTIIDYISKSGLLLDKKVLKENPFNSYGNISEIFSDNSQIANIMSIVESINNNAICIIN